MYTENNLQTLSKKELIQIILIQQKGLKKKSSKNSQTNQNNLNLKTSTLGCDTSKEIDNNKIPYSSKLEIEKLLKDTKKQMPPAMRQEEMFNHWNNWFIFPDKQVATGKNPYFADIELDELKVNDSADTQIEGQTNNPGIKSDEYGIKLLTKTVSQNNKVAWSDFVKDWNILPKSSDCMGNNMHQVFLHHNDGKIDNILLVARGGIVSTKNYHPSKENILCLEFRFKCFCPLDYITISMRSSNMRKRGKGSCGVADQKRGFIEIMPHKDEINIDQKVTINGATKMTKIFKRFEEQHVIVKDDGNEIVFEYMKNDKVLYQLRREVGDTRDAIYGKVQINNSQREWGFMMITELKLYTEKGDE